MQARNDAELESLEPTRRRAQRSEARVATPTAPELRQRAAIGVETQARDAGSRRRGNQRGGSGDLGVERRKRTGAPAKSKPNAAGPVGDDAADPRRPPLDNRSIRPGGMPSGPQRGGVQRAHEALAGGERPQPALSRLRRGAASYAFDQRLRGGGGGEHRLDPIGRGSGERAIDQCVQFRGGLPAAVGLTAHRRSVDRQAARLNVPGDAVERDPESSITLFLCGDVMAGRGIDQILPHPSDPTLHESWVLDARDYVTLAERTGGPIPRPVEPGYLWGDALAELERAAPDVRVLPLETAVTTSEDREEKGIHYRMHPANVASLTAIRPDVCVLANNHVLDWGRRGLNETLDVLHAAGIRTAGAGRDATEAQAPAIVERPRGRVLVFSFAHLSSGIPPSWAATAERGGVNLLHRLSEDDAVSLARRVRSLKRPGDIVLASIHWGGNWGYDVPNEQRRFAHALIDRAAVDLVHGHSSHHAKGVEIYRDRLVLYGCGDFLNDYEGISGYEDYRSELGFMYLPRLDGRSGRLRELRLVPTRIRNLRVNRADEEDTRWLSAMLNREGRAFGTGVERLADGTLRLAWR